MATTHSTLCSRWTALAPVISSPWMTVGPISMVSPWSDGQDLVALLAGLGVRAGRCAMTSWMVSLAVLPIRSSASWASSSLVTPGSSTRIRFSPWRTSVGLGDTEGVDAAAQHLEGLVDVLGVGGRLLGALGLEDELRAAAEVEAEVGLDVDGERQAPDQEAERRGGSGPRHHVTCATSSTDKTSNARIRARTGQRAAASEGSGSSVTQNAGDCTPPWASTRQRPAVLCGSALAADPRPTHPGGHMSPRVPLPRAGATRLAAVAALVAAGLAAGAAGGRGQRRARRRPTRARAHRLTSDATQIVMVRAPRSRTATR